MAYRLGGGRSIRLSYEGEGGALRGALLPITVFLAVKVTGGAGLALWDRALVGVLLCRGATELRPPARRLPTARLDGLTIHHEGLAEDRPAVCYCS